MMGNAPASAARMGINALRTVPELFLNAHPLHQLLYCLLGGFTFYEPGRQLYRRIRLQTQRFDD